MKSNFNNRINAQRKILNLVNAKSWNEELFGLSSGAIERWQQSNPQVDMNVINILKLLGEVLFFLGTKSQEQVTDDYRNLSLDVERLHNELTLALEK